MYQKMLFSYVIGFSLFGLSMLFAGGSDECHNAIRNQVFKNNPKAEKVVFNADSERQRQQSREETQYTGLARYLRHTGEWIDIQWQCVYNQKRNVVVDASYGGITNAPPDNPQNWVEVCQNAVHDKIHSENQAVGKATYQTANTSRLSNEESLVEGTGFVVINGKDVKFDYRCVFNFPAGQVTERNYRLR
jgi:hypothetical protein